MNKKKADGSFKTASTLLHNMSCSSRTHIQHRSHYRRSQGRGIIFSLRSGKDVISELLGQRPGLLPLTPSEDAERELRNRIDAHARTLSFPAAALVTETAEPEDEQCDDLLTIVTVLAKSSANVHLRDKVPNLSQVKPGRRVVLLVPQDRRPA